MRRRKSEHWRLSGPLKQKILSAADSDESFVAGPKMSGRDQHARSRKAKLNAGDRPTRGR
jgi:hypothetical protein